MFVPLRTLDVVELAFLPILHIHPPLVEKHNHQPPSRTLIPRLNPDSYLHNPLHMHPGCLVGSLLGSFIRLVDLGGDSLLPYWNVPC